MRSAELLIVLLTGASSAGCAVLETVELSRSNAPFDLSRTSVLVGSVTQTDPRFPERNDYTEVVFEFAARNGDTRFRVKNAELSVRPGRSSADAGLEAEHGKLFALPVAPGTYELQAVRMWFQASAEATLPEPSEIEVAAGEVVYIGNLEVTNCYSAYVSPDGQRRRQTVVGGFPTIHDRAIRDLPLLRAAYPALNNVTIESRVLDGGGLARQAGDALSRRCSFERDDSQ